MTENDFNNTENENLPLDKNGYNKKGVAGMNLKDYNLYKTLIQYDIIKHRKDYLKELYINEIESFFNHAIHRVNFQFSLIPQKINPILTFTTFEEIPPRLMYKFCEEFDFYSPTVKYLELSSVNGVREYKFVKKIDWEKLKGVDVE